MKVKEKYSHWLPPLLGAGAVTIGKTILYAYKKEDVPERLVRHEMKHIEQYAKYGIIGFILIYLMWYLIGRAKGKGHWEAYDEIPFEKEAVKAEIE